MAQLFDTVYRLSTTIQRPIRFVSTRSWAMGGVTTVLMLAVALLAPRFPNIGHAVLFALAVILLHTASLHEGRLRAEERAGKDSR